MTPPNAKRLFAALDATWPAAEAFDRPPWRIREGRGGGQRVSAATAIAAVSDADVPLAEQQMTALGQRALVMVRDCDEDLDTILAKRNYEIVDPVTLYLADTATLAHPLDITDAMPCWPPLAIQLELWSAAGIGPDRVAVMERSCDPKTSLLARAGDTPVGTAFAAIHDDVAMVHAIEVSKTARRQGAGRRLMQAAANWAAGRGARWITLAVTRANAAANGLYMNLGMEIAAQYHYRRATEPRL